jgi:hypothetical protein
MSTRDVLPPLAEQQSGKRPSNNDLTAVTIGADQFGRLARRPQAKPAYLAQDISRAGGAILLNGRFHSGE